LFFFFALHNSYRDTGPNWQVSGARFTAQFSQASAGTVKRSPRLSSADRDSSLCRSLSGVCRARYASLPHVRQRDTFFPPVTTIAPGMKRAERCCLARMAWTTHLRTVCYVEVCPVPEKLNSQSTMLFSLNFYTLMREVSQALGFSTCSSLEVVVT
jgi:hypothetical protein